MVFFLSSSSFSLPSSIFLFFFLPSYFPPSVRPFYLPPVPSLLSVLPSVLPGHKGGLLRRKEK
jgi:hypothetical protein